MTDAQQGKELVLQTAPVIKFAEATRLLGEQKFDEALEIYKQCTACDPRLAEAWNNMAFIVKEKKLIPQAIEYFEKALECKADMEQARIGLSQCLVDYASEVLRSGNTAETKQLLKKSRLVYRKNPLAWYNLGIVNLMEQKTAKGLMLLEVAMDLHPNWPNGLFVLAMNYRLASKIVECIKTLEKVLEIAPDHQPSRVNLAIAYEQVGNFHRVLKVLSPIIKAGKEKEIPEVANVLGLMHRELGLHKQSAAYFDAHRMKERVIWSNYIFMHNYDPEITNDQIFEIHNEFGKHWGPIYLKRAADAGVHTRIPRLPAPNGVINLGFVGGDLREHSVSYFVEPIFKRLDRSRFDIFVYHSSDTEDQRSAYMKKLIGGDSHWRRINKMDDLEICALIQKDCIHVLIDLSGHTGSNRLDVFAEKPAPLQMTMIGYPNTTGLDTVDYMLTDSTLTSTQAGRPPQRMKEKPLLMPGCFSCYTPPPYSMKHTPEKCQDAEGKVRIGSFTGISKITDHVMKVWARIMQLAPETVLVLKSKLLISKNMTVDYMLRLAKCGIDISRVRLLASQPTTSMHLDCYKMLDITLDTWPYSGTTTTCESMWMGTPVITKLGSRHTENVSASIIRAIGGPLLANICTSEDEYVARVVHLAKNVEDYRRISGKILREMVGKSDLCDQENYCKNFESAIESIVFRNR